MICPKCHGEGKLVSEELKPVTMTRKELIKEEKVCDLCLGTGQVQDNITPIVERLDQIIKLLGEIKKKGGKSNG